MQELWYCVFVKNNHFDCKILNVKTRFFLIELGGIDLPLKIWVNGLNYSRHFIFNYRQTQNHTPIFAWFL